MRFFMNGDFYMNGDFQTHQEAFLHSRSVYQGTLSSTGTQFPESVLGNVGCGERNLRKSFKGPISVWSPRLYVCYTVFQCPKQPLPSRVKTWYCFFSLAPGETMLSPNCYLEIPKHVVLNLCHLNRHEVLSAFVVFRANMDLSSDDPVWAAGASNQTAVRQWPRNNE